MGILNITPDSFSDGGINLLPQKAAVNAQAMVAAGASIVDIGAESTRPGADSISGEEERARLLPALKAVLDAVPGALISVDTYRAETADAALAAGAHIVNDVWGLQKEPDIAQVAARHRAGLVIMHTNRERDMLGDVIADQYAFFEVSLEIAHANTVDDASIVLDPGFGFGKDSDHNLALMARFGELHALGYPLLVGTSRKRFIGAITQKDGVARDIGTVATTSMLRMAGADVFRVHDVAKNIDGLRMADAVLGAMKPH